MTDSIILPFELCQVIPRDGSWQESGLLLMNWMWTGWEIPKAVGESTVQEQNTRKQTVLIIPMSGQKLRANGIISVPIAI